MPKAQAPKDITKWRKQTRSQLLLARTSLAADEQQQISKVVAEKLNQILTNPSDLIIGVYWPISGELDLRELMRSMWERGAKMALPAVVKKEMPITYYEWTPNTVMDTESSKVPIPADRKEILPNVVLAPLLGFDAKGYRLGYGSGYFDRTLAALDTQGLKPNVIGVGHAIGRIDTIYPQAHDIAMDSIVTESEDTPYFY